MACQEDLKGIYMSLGPRIRPYCKHYQHNNMPEDHQCDAKLALIGESLGRHEVEDLDGDGQFVHQPFIGPSGYDLKQWWYSLGLKREDFYIDNVYPYRPPGNKLELIPKVDYLIAANDMLKRLKLQHDLNVVVPTGNYALRALLGDNSVHITDWRGSILPWFGRKCIPTIHPAATQRQKILTRLCIADWARIATERFDRNLNIPERRLVIDPTDDDLREWQETATQYFSRPYLGGPPHVLSVDVENLTTGSRQLTCVGLSFQPNWSITVSVLKKDYESETQWQKSVSWIKCILAHRWPIVGQNFMTDLWKLVQWEPSLREHLQQAYIWDLIEMFHCLDPNDGGDTTEGSKDELEEQSVRVGMLDLGTLTSLYTRQPYYKHLGHSPDRSVRLRYNGMDACIQRELFDVGWKKLNDRQLV